MSEITYDSLNNQITNDVKQFMKEVKSKVAEIKDTLKGAFYANVDEKFDDIVSQYTDALEKQKDQQLKAYDDQITAIDELAAAEERLTDTKDYESRKREIIDKRQYDHENYSVERKLAVYEGRTFDVRRLDRGFYNLFSSS
jgi:primosomal protein N''